jgi:hypothetical protein
MGHGPSSAAIPQFPRLHSIQLTHVSCGGSETWLQAANPQLIEPTGRFCSGSLVQSTTGAVKLIGVLTIASGRSDMTEILGRETGSDRGRSFLVLAP